MAENKETKTEQKSGGRTAVPRGRGQRKNPRRERTPRERVKPEFDNKIVSIRRVTRVVAGGRRFSFSVSLVAGDRKGRVGVGIGKASDTALAIEKALRSAKKSMITVPRKDDGSIAHDIEAKYGTSRVFLYPAPGRGIVAGGAVREVLLFAGVKNTGSKILSRSKNHLNNARAAIKALSTLRATSRMTHPKKK